eukprot:767796-Hanusia_phi.AAC.2
MMTKIRRRLNSSSDQQMDCMSSCRRMQKWNTTLHARHKKNTKEYISLSSLEVGLLLWQFPVCHGSYDRWGGGSCDVGRETNTTRSIALPSSASEPASELAELCQARLRWRQKNEFKRRERVLNSRIKQDDQKITIRRLIINRDQQQEEVALSGV